MDPARRRPAQGDPSPVLSQEVRSVLSFLIFLHLFALGIAITGSNAGLASPLQRRLHESLAPMRFYLQMLHMDLAYNYHLTHAEMLDIDHRLEVDLQLPDGATETVVLPDDSTWPRTRRRRYQTLGLTVASQIGNAQMESVLPRAVAGALMAQTGAEQATIRCRGHFLLSADDVGSVDPARSDPWNEQLLRTLYEARVLLTDGEVSIVKTSDDEAMLGGAGGFPEQAAPPPSQP